MNLQHSKLSTPAKCSQNSHLRWPFPFEQRHFHLNKGDEMSVHFRNCWMDFDICCFELASLDVLISADSRFKPVVGGEIWYPYSAKRVLEAKKHRFSASEKMPFFRRFFGRPTGRRGPPRKHSEKETSWKIHPGNISQKSNFFWNFILHKLWRVRKNAIISFKVDSQNIVIFSTSEAKKRQKFDPLRDG